MQIEQFRCWTLGLGMVLGLICLPQARAADDAAKPQKVKFMTSDRVELKGYYYASEKKTDAPCVMFVHDIGGNCQQKGWDSLARKLQEKGFAVLRFDLRGHGDSTSVGEGFWGLPPNQNNVKGYKGYNKGPDSIKFKDFRKQYYPYLVNDLIAAKNFFDKKNDSSECNSQNMIVIGEKMGAALGALWMKTECYRAKITGLNLAGVPVVEKDSQGRSIVYGQDIVCGVWLSISPLLSTKPSTLLWLPGHEKKIPMAFLYGDKDVKGKTLANSTANLLKRGQDKDFARFTGAYAIKGANKLAGRQLLTDDLETEKFILTYLVDEVLKKRRELTAHDSREVKKYGYLWLPPGARVVIGKKMEEKEPVLSLLNCQPFMQ
jgi:pimeloyl-ACP methyl ester carboxylesterase